MRRRAGSANAQLDYMGDRRLTLEHHRQECRFCGTRGSVQTKVFYRESMVIEIISKPCYECGCISYDQEKFIEEMKDN